MPLIPWEYIKECLLLPKITLKEIGEKLTYCGLETKIVEHKNGLYLEFEVLPNRPDLLSWWGIIQEMGILLNCQVKPLNFPTVNESEEKLIEGSVNTSDCIELYLGLIKNVKVKESPTWIKEWLEANNIRSVNNVIDIVNLALLESGQSLHVFDYDALPEKKIVIRKAYQEEKINILRGQELTLNSEDTITSSGRKVISLAGIIGSRETAMTPHTQNILIECANFNSSSIKKTAKRLNISTAASHFFSRGANVVLSPQQVLARTISLIINTYQGDLNSGIIFPCQEIKKTSSIITISQEFIKKKTGQIITDQTIETIWQQLNFLYQKKRNDYHITIPSWRPDITNPEDLLEELLRIYDYNKLVGSLPNNLSGITYDGKNEDAEKQKRFLRNYLANNGWQEIITYSLVSSEMKKDFLSLTENDFYQLLMPKNEHHEYYRQTLVPSHLKTLKYNLSHGNKDLFFFEISSVYGPNHSEELLILSGMGKFFNQPLHKLVQEADFYWLKGVLENIFELWQINFEITFTPTSLDYLYSPQSTEIFIGKEKIGFLGRIHPQITQKYQINEATFAAQISLSRIFNYLNNNPFQTPYQPVSNFPTSTKDLSFIFPESIDYNEIIKEIKRVAGKNLQEVNVFDIYQSAELEREEKKSVSLHLTFQSHTKTLESKEIEKTLKEIVEKIEQKFAAKLRD